MRNPAQDKFRRRVRLWLINRNKTVTDLALTIQRRRDTVSTAIHHDRFPRVRKLIEEVISK